MEADVWVQIIIFLVVFVVTGIILSRKKENRDNRYSLDEYEEIQAEILEPQNIDHRLTQDTVNPYEILGVHKNDPWETIDNVYRRLIDIYRPERHTAANHLSLEQKRELTAQIDAAYHWLKQYHNIT